MSNGHDENYRTKVNAGRLSSRAFEKKNYEKARIKIYRKLGMLRQKLVIIHRKYVYFAAFFLCTYVITTKHTRWDYLVDCHCVLLLSL